MQTDKIMRKSKKYIIRNFINIILMDIPIVVFFIISILLVIYIYGIDTSVKLQSIFFIVFLIFVPVIIFIIFRCLKLIKNKYITIAINILSFILIPVSILFYMYFTGIIYVTSLFHAEFADASPLISEYSTEVKKLSEKEYRIEHFPSDIPENAQNYKFIIDSGEMYGYCIHYLKFNIDNKYLNKVIEQSKNKIYQKLPLNKVSEYYRNIGNIGKIPIENEYKYTVYILKNENNDDLYTSGFIISKELHEIIYFYSDYNLKQYNTKM